MTIRDIPLNQLIPSAANVRVAKVSKQAQGELMASIKAEGLLQNLVAVPSTGSATYEIIAGGRRYLALKGLAEAGHVPEDHPVTCRVRSATDNTTSLSLTENLQREPMHPADQYQAFANLARRGLGAADIAARFGFPMAHVKKLLKLGDVAKSILADYRKGTLNLDQVIAFAAVDDRKRQIACYKELGEHCSAYSIRRWLLGEAVEASRGIGAFVGVASYEKAGGAVAHDLFQEAVHLLDAELVERLALGKLESKARQLSRAGAWSWVTFGLDREELTRGLVHLETEVLGMPAEKTDALERLRSRLTSLESLSQQDEVPDGWGDFADVFEAVDRAESELWELEQVIEAEYATFTVEQRSYGGAVVTLDWHGKLQVIEGLARKQDVPQTPADGLAGPEGAGEGAEPAGKPLPQALVSDLAAHRRLITKVALLDDGKLAVDLLHYGLCVQVLTERAWEGRALCNATYHVVPCETAQGEIQQGPAQAAWDAAKASLNVAWLEAEDGAARFSAFCALSRRDKDKLVTFCTADILHIGERQRSPEQDQVVAALNPDFRAYWQPSAEHYLKRLTIPQLLDTFGPVMGEHWTREMTGCKKGLIVARLAEAFREDYPEDDPRATWVPEAF